MLFFADSGEGVRAQAMLMGSATTVIVLTLAAINALDNPYRAGLGQIKPVAMERSLRILDTRARRRERSRLRCRATPGALGSRPDGRTRARLASTATSSSPATVLLAVAAVATAWAAYQSARWHGEQARAQSASIAARVESTRAANVANRQGQIDVALFTQWVDAYARDETELAAFYDKRFRPEFKPAFDAWVATRPRKNPSAPLSPFAMPQYKLAATAAADRLEAKAAASSQRVGRVHPAGRRLLAGRRPVRLVAVLRGHQHAASHVRRRGWSSSGSGVPCSLGSVIWIATFPVSLSV